MSLAKRDKQEVKNELLQHVEILRSLPSCTPEVPSQPFMCPPQRVTRNQWKLNSCWRPREAEGNGNRIGDYVFCHNHLGQHNVLVDPESSRITAIIDWEFGGFWPAWFEHPFWERPGLSAALEGEEDDVERFREWLIDHCTEEVIPRKM